MKFSKAFKAFTKRKQPNKEQTKLRRMMWAEGAFLYIYITGGQKRIELVQNGIVGVWIGYATDLLAEDWEIVKGEK